MEAHETQSEREKKLRQIFSGIDGDVNETVSQLIDETVYLEQQLTLLRGDSMFRVHPQNPELVKVSPRAKLYKEFLQQYTNCIKSLLAVLNKNAPEEVSPLRQWLEERQKQHEPG